MKMNVVKEKKKEKIIINQWKKMINSLLGFTG
jgi:hypothetical protein